MAINFGFAFNSAVFSDRVLRIELIPDSLDSKGDGAHNRNRSRKGSDKQNVAQVKTLHINSLLLAANSPFFQKLFENGMRESQQKDVTLKINASEEEALMDILKFMYTTTMSATTVTDLINVLMVADKFEVTSCIKYCGELLQKMPMSLELSVLYLELASSVLGSESVHPLIAAAKKYLLECYSDFTTSQKEMMELPLCAVEALLGSDGLRVDSEDEVFDYILKWARAHYPKLKERREILAKRLVQCICLPYMSCSKLEEVLVCPDFCHEKVSKLVMEALFVKLKVPYLQKIKSPKDLETSEYSSLVRIYKYRPFQVVRSEHPQPRCVVYFDLKKEECKNLSQSRRHKSPSFCLGGRFFYLSAGLGYIHQEKSATTFGLYVYMTKESENCTVDYEMWVMNKLSKEFQKKIRIDNIDKTILTNGWGAYNLLGIPWADFMSKDCEYFIDGILHLRVDLTIKDVLA